MNFLPYLSNIYLMPFSHPRFEVSANLPYPQEEQFFLPWYLHLMGASMIYLA
ncbi:hypothetical protein [Lentibacillus sediminis]|uniref:hypothetical protein n=1 Tax=Lentibacillus sediminis TaxID=1940529 RepID=UPI0013045253|nr:hypothetical protein [Lentibacillus sediminis]